MQIPFRFRIRRIGSCFADKCTVEVFVTSDGKVRGTVRNISDGSAFIPVELAVPVSDVAELKTSFLESTSAIDDPWINIGYGENAETLTVKGVCPPSVQTEHAAESRLWNQCVDVCKQVPHDRS